MINYTNIEDIEIIFCVLGSCPSFYPLAEGIMISVISLQRSEGDVSDSIKYTNS